MFWSAGKRRREPASDPASQLLTYPPAELNPPSPGPIHSWARPAAFALVVLAGAVLLWIALGPHDVADYHAESDFLGGYAEGARGVQSGHLDPARYQVVGPVYEIAIALVGFVTRDLSLAGKLVSVTAACGSLLLWFLLLERRSGPVAGLWTLAFLAVNPVFVRYGSSMTTDMLATLVQAAALFALFGRHGRRAPLWAGVLTGVAVLTRYNAIYLVPAVLVSDAWRSPAGAGSRLRTGVRFAAGFAAVTLP